MKKAGEQGNQSSWEKARGVFFLCLVAVCVYLSVLLTGCSQAGTASSGETSAASESASSASSSATAPSESSEPASASSESSKVAPSASSESIGVSDFVGSWQVTQVTYPNDESGEKNVPPEDFNDRREKGLDEYVVYNSDGSAVYVLAGVYLYGTWEIDDKISELGLGPGALATFYGPDGGSMLYAVYPAESRMYMMRADSVTECDKTEDKKPLAKEENDAALEAFIGTWHLVSATRDGVTITRDAGQITADATIEFKNNMKATMTYNEKSVESSWRITGANSGYFYNPDDEDTFILSDGVLIEDMGENGTMSYVKD